jgi:transposase-like protein
MLLSLRNRGLEQVLLLITDGLKCVYNASPASKAEAILYDFMVKYSKIYPKAVAVLEDLTSLFLYYEFLMAIRRSIDTTNLIENLNKNLKRGTKRKEQFPNEDSLERYVCSFYCDYNQTMDCRVHKGFKEMSL